MGGTRKETGVGRSSQGNCSRWIACHIATWLQTEKRDGSTWPNSERFSSANSFLNVFNAPNSKASRGLLASATLSAIARFTIIHRAILARLRTTRLVCRETDRANRGYQNRKHNLEIIVH